MGVKIFPREGRFTQTQIDEAKETAKRALEIEIESRLGEDGVDGYGMKAILWGKNGTVYPILDTLFESAPFHPDFTQKDMFYLCIKILAQVIQSRVILMISEAWTAGRCHACGESFAISMENNVCRCGADMCLPSQNPYKKEVLVAALTVCGNKDAENDMTWMWVYHINRDDSGKIIEFVPEKEVFENSTGRMTEHWCFDSNEVPHFIVNYPQFCECLGIECEPKHKDMAELVKATCPSNYQLLNFCVSDSETFLKNLAAPDN